MARKAKPPVRTQQQPPTHTRTLTRLHHPMHAIKHTYAGATVGVWDIDAHQAELPHLLDGIGGEGVFFIPLRSVRGQLLGGKIRAHVFQHLERRKRRRRKKGEREGRVHSFIHSEGKGKQKVRIF